MRTVISILLASALCGCATPYAIGREQNGDLLAFKKPTPTRVTEINPDTITAKGNLDAVQARELAEALLSRSDVYCQDYLTGVSVLNNATASILDITALTLSSAVPVTTPTRSKNLLGAISAVASGSKTALSNDILGGKDFGLIHDAIINGRKEERKVLEAEESDGKFKDWNAEAILAHIQPYHADCGIEFGLQYLRAMISKQNPPAANTASTDAAAALVIATAKEKSARDSAQTKIADAASAKADADAKAATASQIAGTQAMPADKTAAATDAAKSRSVYDSMQKAAAAAVTAEGLWAVAKTEADNASKAYTAADAQQAVSDKAAKDADDLKKSLGAPKSPS